MEEINRITEPEPDTKYWVLAVVNDITETDLRPYKLKEVSKASAISFPSPDRESAELYCEVVLKVSPVRIKMY